MRGGEELRSTLTMILAGGQGERLAPLTVHRSKPGVPFAGIYRIIDFTLSNVLNSGLRRVWVLTQYKSASLMRHIMLGWNLFSAELGEYVYTLPPQRRIGTRWYEGTADAVYQNAYIFRDERPDRVLILSGDHVYRMDYAEMIEAHVASGRDVTIAVCEIDRADASRFGVVETDDSDRAVAFAEKVENPPAMPGRPDRCLANMGIYLFETALLEETLQMDHTRAGSSHDFGRDVLPVLVSEGRVGVHPLKEPGSGTPGYWRDIGTIDAYHDASMDLVSVTPQFNLYDRSWPIRTLPLHLPPAKSVFDGDTDEARRGESIQSLVSGGCIVSGGHVLRSILSPHVRVRSYSHVENSVLMDDVEVGRHAQVQRAIVDKHVRIPEGCEIGIDPAADRERFHVSPEGVVVIGRGEIVES